MHGFFTLIKNRYFKGLKFYNKSNAAMYLKNSFILILLFCISQQIHSQSLSNRVIATGGSFSTASWGSLSATIGEATINTLTSSTVTLLQGFQQPTSGLSGITNIAPKLITATIYPNPSQGNIYLEVTLPASSTLTYKIFDLNGKELQAGEFTADALHTTIQKLNCSGFSSGMYLLSLSSNEVPLQNFKFQINH